jgi:CIC family chloride channel protein
VSGATRAPLTAIFIVYELTNDSSYVMPLMIVSVVSYVTARRFAEYGLYDGWLAARGEHLAHGVDQAVMEHIRLRDVLDVDIPRAAPAMRVDDLARLMREARLGTVAVVDDNGALVGVIGHHELNAVLLQPVETRQLVIAEDLVERVEAVRPTESLRTALAVMNARGRDAVPVVEAMDGGRECFIGLVSRAAAFAAYDRALEHAV